MAQRDERGRFLPGNSIAIGILKNQYWEKHNENVIINPEAAEMLSLRIKL